MSAQPTRAVRAMTPKEFSDAVGGLLSPYTVREKCRLGDLSTVNGPGRPPYYIKPEELAKYRCDLSRFLISA